MRGTLLLTRRHPSVLRSLEEKFELNLPQYPGFSQIVELPQREGES